MKYRFIRIDKVGIKKKLETKKTIRIDQSQVELLKKDINNIFIH